MPALNQNPRAWIIRIVFSLMAIILIARLFNMQVMEDKYVIMANDQAIYRKVIYPARGVIVDRNGKSLLENKVTIDLMVTPSKVHDLDTALFCSIMEMSPDEFESKMQKLVTRNGSIRPSVFEAFVNDRKTQR